MKLRHANNDNSRYSYDPYYSKKKKSRSHGNGNPQTFPSFCQHLVRLPGQRKAVIEIPQNSVTRVNFYDSAFGTLHTI